MAAGPRKKGESFDDYRNRLKYEEIAIKKHLNGTLLWNSSVNGTYNRKTHGKLGERK